MTTHRMSATIAAKLAFDVIAAAVDYLKDRESEVTQREYIRAHRDVLVTALNNEKEVLLDYFEKRFAERREALEQFYDLLHTAVETGDPIQLQASLAGILGIIKENPLGDLVAFRQKWDDPKYVIDL